VYSVKPVARTGSSNKTWRLAMSFGSFSYINCIILCREKKV